jgi:lipocalin
MKQLLKILSSALVMVGIFSPSICVSCMGSKTADVDTSTVRSLDVKRFMGRWYEIARFDHRFERGMTHATADYTLLPEGKIRVVNSGMKNGKPAESVGKAKQPNPAEYPGRLKVSFFLWFYSDYYVLELAPDYTYAVIGSSSDDYLWILSRTPQLPSDVLLSLLELIEARGYDISELIWVEQ